MPAQGSSTWTHADGEGIPRTPFSCRLFLSRVLPARPKRGGGLASLCTTRVPGNQKYVPWFREAPSWGAAPPRLGSGELPGLAQAPSGQGLPRRPARPSSAWKPRGPREGLPAWVPGREADAAWPRAGAPADRGWLLRSARWHACGEHPSLSRTLSQRVGEVPCLDVSHTAHRGQRRGGAGWPSAPDVGRGLSDPRPPPGTGQVSATVPTHSLL